MAIKQIAISQKISSGNKNFEVKGDIIVPDIKPDIVSITASNANTYIYKEELSSGKIRVDGNIDAYIIYLSDNGETRSIQTTLDFMETINDEKAIEGKNIFTKIRIDFLEAKILNERKISIEAKLCIQYQITEKVNLEINTNFEELGEMQRLTENVNLPILVGENKVRTSAKEDIRIDAEDDAGEILKVDLKLENCEAKTSYNKVLAKAEARVEILYITENGKIKKVEANLPIMSFIDIENVAETNECNVKYTVRNMLVKINSREMHSINFQTEFEVYCIAMQKEEILLTKDMYSLENELELEKKNIAISLEETNEELPVQIVEKISVEDIENVYSIQATPRIINSTQSGDVINYEGEVELIIYYSSDNKSNISVKQVKITFMKKSINAITTDDLTVKNCKYSLSGEEVTVEMEIGIDNSNSVNKEISYINNVVQKENDCRSDYNMFLYFVKSGDTIWNIAKKFKVSMQDVIDMNNLENPDKINVGDRLYIMK